MSEPLKRTYLSWLNGEVKSEQKEYTDSTDMLAPDGTLTAAGWARHMVFNYDRKLVKPAMRSKEWDFYQISNGRYMVQINFANISLGGFITAALVDLKNPNPARKLGAGTLYEAGAYFVGGRAKYPLPARGDVPNRVGYTIKAIGEATFDFNTTENKRTLYFKSTLKGEEVECKFEMDIPEGLENITTLLPFKNHPTSFFMTTKQNCMPCAGTYRVGEKVFEFSREDTFATLDWGRVNSPYRLVWYWGNGSTYLTDAEGKKHPFGFEITWGIGDESKATETAIFYDGKAHKFGPVDVKTFPKPDGYMNKWEFVSEDGRFNLTMTPFYDHHNDLNIINVLRMHSHQVHGLWNGAVKLDDGTELEIHDMYAFCEYVENKW